MIKNALILMVLVLLSCNKNEKGECTGSIGDGLILFEFSPSLYGKDIETTREYVNDDNIRFRISDLKFYLSFKAVTKKGDTIGCVDQVRFFNLLDTTLTNFTIPLPSGTYKALILGTGLNTEINDTDPSTLEPEHILSAQQGTYWSWANGYKFFQLEGMTATFKEDTAVLMNGLLYHVGTNATFYERRIKEDFKIKRKGLQIFKLNLHLEELFNAVYDIDIINEDYTQTSNKEELDLALKLIENFNHSFEIIE